MKWSVIKVSGEHPDWVCPIVDQSHNEQTRRHTRQITVHNSKNKRYRVYQMCIYMCIYIYTHTHKGLLSGSCKTSLPAPCWRPYRRVRLGLSPATERGPPYRYRCSCCYCLPAVRPLKRGSWRVRGIPDEPPKCCTRIAESHQTPQELRIDAKTVRNFTTS